MARLSPNPAADQQIASTVALVIAETYTPEEKQRFEQELITQAARMQRHRHQQVRRRQQGSAGALHQPGEAARVIGGLAIGCASSNFPHFDVNPNSGEPEGAMEHPRIARNQVLADAAHPSHLVLPVIP